MGRTMNKKFEFLKHTGDLKFKAYGKNINELFENSVLAVASVFSRGNKIKKIKKVKIKVSGRDYESLLYKLIEELISLLDTDCFVVNSAEIKISNFNLEATLHGDNSADYSDLDAVKSPTYAEMYVKEEKGLWEAQVVLDV